MTGIPLPPREPRRRWPEPKDAAEERDLEGCLLAALALVCLLAASVGVAYWVVPR
jgi:hypothetical protein